MSSAFPAGRLPAVITPATDSERAMVTLCLSRHDADDLIEMLGLDTPQPEREDVDRSRPRHHQNHIFASARRIA